MNLPVPASPGRNLIVCPANDDGLVCSIILNRSLETILNTIFLPENSVGDIFDYPVAKKLGSRDRLYLAGFSHQKGLEVPKPSAFRAGVRWFSHHFWAEDALRGLNQSGWELHGDTACQATSGLLIRHFHIRDRSLIKLADGLAGAVRPEDGRLRSWFYLSLALRTDFYGIRKALEPLYEPWGESLPEPDPQRVAEGEELFHRLGSLLEEGHHYCFPMDILPARACVVGAPGSLARYYRTLAALALERLECFLAFLLFDGDDQIVLCLGEGNAGPLDAEGFAEKIDRVLAPGTARLYDRRTLTLVPPPKMGKIEAVEKLSLAFSRPDSD